MHSRKGSTFYSAEIPQRVEQPAAPSKEMAQRTLLQTDGLGGADLMAAQTMDASGFIDRGFIAHQANRPGRADTDAVPTRCALGRHDLRSQDKLVGHKSIQ